MLETRTRFRIPVRPSAGRGPRSRLELELRDVAEAFAGHADRDELRREEEQLLADAIDAAVAAALPAVVEILDRELTPRIEALPLSTRMTLARIRRRRDIGLE